MLSFFFRHLEDELGWWAKQGIYGKPEGTFSFQWFEFDSISKEYPAPVANGLPCSNNILGLTWVLRRDTTQVDLPNCVLILNVDLTLGCVGLSLRIGQVHQSTNFAHHPIHLLGKLMLIPHEESERTHTSLGKKATNGKGVGTIKATTKDHCRTRPSAKPKRSLRWTPLMKSY